MTIEAITFSKGLNLRKNPFLLSEGELVSCSGFSFDIDGQMTAREARTQEEIIDTETGSLINGLHRYGSSMYASSRAYCPGKQAHFNYIYKADVGSNYEKIAVLAGNKRPRFADYNGFTFMVDGESKKACINGNVYEWGVENPSHAPDVVPGVAGNPDGDYSCYVTFWIQFPNGKTMETGPSAVAEVTVVTQKITWSHIPVCPYSAEDVIIHRRLYRTVSGTAYLVTRIPDNTQTTYTDDVTDATLQAAAALGTTGYSTPPNYATDIAVYLERIFLIKENKLYWSEAYSPFTFKATSYVVVGEENEVLKAVVNWGDQLYIGSSREWYRLQGSDPDTWAIKRTFSDCGTITRDTVVRTKYGLLTLHYNGIYIFDGSFSRNLTARYLGESFFTDLDDLSVSWAEFDGTRYWFYYASSDSTLDSCIIIDFTYAPEYRIYSDNFVADAFMWYPETGVKYLAKDGYEYSTGGTEIIPLSLQTGDYTFKNALQRKNPRYLYYDIDTSGNDVTVILYADGANFQSLILNTAARTRKRSKLLKQIDGYHFSLALSCADGQNVIIYEPWALEAVPVGE